METLLTRGPFAFSLDLRDLSADVVTTVSEIINLSRRGRQWTLDASSHRLPFSPFCVDG